MKARPFSLSIVTERQIALFEAKIDKSGKCWLWMGSRVKDGYGDLYIGSEVKKTSRVVKAHRLAWLIEHPFDTLGPDDCVLHSCDNPPCCRPDHLFIGTKADNNYDKLAKGRHRAISGEQCHNAKLTRADIPVIRASKEKQAALAARYGVSHQVIWMVKRGKAWSHVA
ncbi:MAG: HNH endonuclease [Planctomycetota bacterium]